MLSLLTARVRDAALRTPLLGRWRHSTLRRCAACWPQHGLTDALVPTRRCAAPGHLHDHRPARRAGCAPTPPAASRSREVAHFDLFAVAADADLFEALWLMLRHRVHRLLVRDGDGSVLGVLGQLDLVAFVADHSHIVALQIDAAARVDELRAGGRSASTRMVALLHDGGIKVERIARARRRAERAPVRARSGRWSRRPSWSRNSCLLVMGSEGRGEQILKTDQDNALLLRDGLAVPDALRRDRRRASTPRWRRWATRPAPATSWSPTRCGAQPLAALPRDAARLGLRRTTPKARCTWRSSSTPRVVAGDAALLTQRARPPRPHRRDSDAFLARFAARGRPVRASRRAGGSG